MGNFISYINLKSLTSMKDLHSILHDSKSSYTADNGCKKSSKPKNQGFSSRVPKGISSKETSIKYSKGKEKYNWGQTK